ncbi:MAG TPA: hypothetical protein VHP38_17665 [Ruminiclostridium sp.]|nr:hypothetical protein [Ruminiclostridium sp.]
MPVPVTATPRAEGFLGATWGMGAEKIDKVMTAQGFGDKTVLNQGNALRYRGNFYGYPCYLNLSLWDDKFYEGTASAICQTREVAGNSEVRVCFTLLAQKMIAEYGEPTQKNEWEGARTYFWDKLPGRNQYDEIYLLLSEHFAEGGQTEGSVQVHFMNRTLEDCLYYRMMGRRTPYACPVY